MAGISVSAVPQHKLAATNVRLGTSGTSYSSGGSHAGVLAGGNRGTPTPAPPMMTNTGGGGGGGAKAKKLGGALPPNITEMKTTAAPPPELTAQSKRMTDYLADLKAGTGKAADVNRANVQADIERQVQAAKEQAAAEGRPFDEEAMRAELARGSYKAEAEQALGRESMMGEALRGALPTIQAPSQAALEQRRQSASEQGQLMDYWLGRYGAETGRIGAETSRMAANQQAQQAWMSMLSNMLNVSVGI